MKKTSIYHFSTLEQGGAGIAARAIYESLTPLENLNLQWFSRKNDPWQKSISLDRKIANRIRQFSFGSRLSRSTNKLDVLSSPKSWRDTPLTHIPSIIHLHWIPGFIDFPSFFNSIPDNTPIIWTIHDSFPYTAICHANGSCQQYLTSCSNCPQLDGLNFWNGIITQYFNKLKKEAFANKNIHFVATNKINHTKVSKAFLTSDKDVSIIPYGIDESIFKIDTNICNSFNDRLKVGFFVDGYDRQKKGLLKLADAIVNKKNIEVVVVGKGKPNYINQENISFLGPVERNELFRLYNQMHVSIQVSDDEAFGMGVVESLLSGTPVITTKVGIAPEVINRQNGLLISDTSPKTILDSFDYIKKNLNSYNKATVRKSVLGKFAIHEQARKYRLLYDKVINHDS